jgi:hypothetical protein
MQERERRLAGREGLQRQMEHDRRVFTDRVEHHRVFELGHHFPDNVNALGLELLEVS